METATRAPPAPNAQVAATLDDSPSSPPSPTTATTTTTGTKRLVPAKHRTVKPWAVLPSMAVLLPILALFTWVSVRLHYQLPTPGHALFSPDGTPIFSESHAMRYIKDLASYGDGTPRYRILGTREMVETDEYLLDKVRQIRDDVVQRHPDGGMQLEVWHQTGDGTHVRPLLLRPSPRRGSAG